MRTSKKEAIEKLACLYRHLGVERNAEKDYRTLRKGYPVRTEGVMILGTSFNIINMEETPNTAFKLQSYFARN